MLQLKREAEELPNKILFLDFDGTIVKPASRMEFPIGIWDINMNIGLLNSIKNYKPKMCVIVSNQGGIVEFRCANNNIGVYKSDEDTEINHGELLKKININEEDLYANIFF